MGVAKLALRETNERYLRESAYTDLQFYPGHFAHAFRKERLSTPSIGTDPQRTTRESNHQGATMR